jgi:hypothetical protein
MLWRDLLTYWRSKHVGLRPPSRADIDPIEDIPSLVRSLFLMDVVGGQFRYRLIGSDIVEWAGRDSTGKLIDESLMHKTDLTVWLVGLSKVARTQRPLLAVTRPAGSEFAPLVALVLPLVAPDGSTEMIFGGLFRILDRRFRQTVDLMSIHGLVEYGIPDNLADDPVQLPVAPPP